ncbi:MAG TPA: DUF6114 domain-containing protein [Actinocrinis sp.]|nr:DUF6114 domain-containing protein [Actinocrinis sp.]
MTGSEQHEGSAGYDPAESGGPRPDGYPEFPPLPAERERPQAPDPEGTDPGGAGGMGAAAAVPGARAPAAAGSFALAETHPQPAVRPGLEVDPDALSPVPAFGAGMAAYAAAPNVSASPVAASHVAASHVTEPETPPQGAASGSLPHRMRLGFRDWRRSRPFWGGLFVVLGGGEILFSEKAPLRVIVHFGLTGLAGYLIPSVMVLCGVLLVFNPGQRLFYSILSVLLALATWPTSNLGGFLIGMLLGLIGGSLGFAWMPLSQTPPPKASKRKPPKAAAQG